MLHRFALGMALTAALAAVQVASADILKPVSVTTNITGDAGSSHLYLLDDNSAFADASLQRPVGTAATLETGASLADALATYGARGGGAHAESWTFGTGGGNPEFVFDLGAEQAVGSVIMWQYGNNGGDVGRGGNSTRDFELIFHTAAEGNTFDFGTEAVEFTGTMDPILEMNTIDNVAQFFGFDSTVDAQYVGLRIANNYLGQPDIIAGGDRYGLGEVRFATEQLVPEPTSLVLLAVAGLAAIGMMIRRRR